MSDIRNPALRPRDIRKIINRRRSLVSWERGVDETSEWVYASTENPVHRGRLVDWLLSKEIPPDVEVFQFDSSFDKSKSFSWKDLTKFPESYFGDSPFEVVDLDLTFILNYWSQGVARFGRIQNRPNQQVETTQAVARPTRLT